MIQQALVALCSRRPVEYSPPASDPAASRNSICLSPGSESMEKKRVLVTGASGLIGQIVLRKLGMKYAFSGLNRRPVEGIPHLQADIADLAAIRPAFQAIDTVVHLAGYTGSADDPGVKDWEG